jgi:hypothetical protein
MRKYLVIVMLCLGAFAGAADASNLLVINRDVTGDGELDEVKLVGNDGLFYTLSIISNGKEILRNENLVPKGIVNKGGLEIFQGLSVADRNISLRYRFCTPSKSVCYDRTIVGAFKEDKFVVLREGVVASADKIALSEIFNKKTEMLLSSLTYQSLIAHNENAENLFSGMYGDCVLGLGGDALTKISEELEKASPDNWVMSKGCVTAALVFNLEAQKYLSREAASRYLSAIETGEL